MLNSSRAGTYPNFIHLPIGLALLLTALSQIGCAPTPSGGSELAKLSELDCKELRALLADPTFTTVGEIDSVWTFKQHAGDLSFSLQAVNEELEFSRTGDEPWGVLSQIISDSRLRGREIRFSADLRGDIAEEVNHAFGAKAGLWLSVGARSGVNMADHVPNIGQWDWEEVKVQAEVPEIYDYIEVGFLYQGGEGALSARAPKLELAECSP